MRTYSQLTQIQGYQIYALMQMGHSQSEIAEVIGVHKSTISKELKRNKGKRGYRPKQAHSKAVTRHNKARKRLSPEEWEIIESKLEEDLSPEQTSHWVWRQHGIQVSHA